MRDLNRVPDSWNVSSVATFVDNMTGGASPKGTDYSATGTLALNKGDIKTNGVIESKKTPKLVPASYALKNENKLVEKGAVLVTLRDLSQKANFLGLASRFEHAEKALITQGMYRLDISKYCSEKFLIWYTNSPLYRAQVKNEKVGATQVHLRNEQFLGLIIPLPPLAEQKIIAQKLDLLLEQVETTKARLDRIPDILKRFRQSVLTAAVSGKLTEEWREGRQFGDRKCLGEIIETGPQNGIYKQSTFYGRGTKILRIDSFYDGAVIDWSEIKRVEIEDSELAKWQLNLNDLLINRVNSIEYLGKCALIRELPENAVFESNIMRMSIKSDFGLAEFVAIFLRSPEGLDELRKNAKLAVNQASINQTDVKNCAFLLPSIEEQTQIVEQVTTLFAYANAIEKQVQAARERVNSLTQSILAKAFRGELTAEWRTANPELISGNNSAEALLEKIKIECEVIKLKRKTRKKA